MTKHLANLQQARRPRRGAFTLIEILVVVVILVIVITLIVNVGSYIRTNAAEKKTRSLEAILMTAVQAFYENQHAYPQEGRVAGDNPLFVHDIPAGTNTELAALLRSKNLFYRLNNVPAAKAKLAALPADAIGIDSNAARQIDDRVLPDPPGLHYPADLDGSAPPKNFHYFRDNNGIPFDYRANLGLGGVPVIISAGPDKYHGKGDSGNTDEKYLRCEDDNIRSDR
jgi:prepilin-type N-terminal cleavage/methylation domain-containing protein